MDIRKRAPSSRRKIRIYILAVLAFILLLLSAALRVASGWDVSDISVSGNRRVGSRALTESLLAFAAENLKDAPYLFKILGVKNVFYWRSLDWQKFILGDRRLASIDSFVSVSGRSASFSFRERTEQAIWCEDKNCFWFDENGVIFKRAPFIEGSLVFQVNDETKRELRIGDTIFQNKEFTGNLLSIISFLNNAGLAVKRIELTDLNREEISAYLVNGPRMDFSLRIKPDWADGVVASFVADKKFRDLEYIDLRVENRAYYR